MTANLKASSEIVDDQTPSHRHSEMCNTSVEKSMTNLEDDPHRAALEDNPEQPEKLTWRAAFAIFFMGLAISAPVGIGFLTLTPILGPIGDSLGSTARVGWIAIGWSTACAVSFSLAGSLSDIFGRKYIIILGQAFILVGAIVACTAHQVREVIVGSTLVGWGAGFTFIVYAAIPEVLPNKYRGIGLSWAEGCIVCPWGFLQSLLAFQLVEHASWRWLYYIMIIMTVITTVGITFTYYPPPRRHRGKTRLNQFLELDWIGMALYTTGLTVFLIGLSWAGTPGYPWKSVSVILPIVLGFLTFCSCFAYDWTFAKKPFFPYSLLGKVREYSLLLVGMFVAGMVFFSMSTMLTQDTIYLFSSDGLKAGLIQLPNGFGQLIGGTLIPAFMHKIRFLRWQLVAALAIQTIFTACYAATIPNSKAAWMALQFFGNICFSWATLCAYVTAGLNVPLRDLGVATGVIGTFRSSGGAAGIAIFNTIFASVLNSKLGPKIAEAAASHRYPITPSTLAELIPAVQAYTLGNSAPLRALKGVTPAVESAVLAASKLAYSEAYQMVFFSTIPFGVIATATVAFVKESSGYLTNHTAVHLKSEGHEEHDHAMTRV